METMKTLAELTENYLWQSIEFDETKGYPYGMDLFYECQICQRIVPSLPDKKNRDTEVECSCGNLIVDADAGRLYVSKPNSVKLYKRIPKGNLNKYVLNPQVD